MADDGHQSEAMAPRVPDASVRHHSYLSLSGSAGGKEEGNAKVTVSLSGPVMTRSAAAEHISISDSDTAALGASGTTAAGVVTNIAPSEAVEEQQQTSIDARASHTHESSVRIVDPSMHLGLQKQQPVAVAGSTTVPEQQPAAGGHQDEAKAPAADDAGLLLGLEVGSTLHSSAGCLLADTPRLPAASLPQGAADGWEKGLQDNNAIAAGTRPAGTAAYHRLVHVSAHEAGTYAFKGCGAVDMACLVSEELLLLPQAAHSMRPQRGAKGALIMPSSGPVPGLQGCPVVLPNVMWEFRQAWSKERFD
eukprot:gene5276-5511_t